MRNMSIAPDVRAKARVKPSLRGVSHQVGFVAMLFAGTWLIHAAASSTAKIVCAVYAISVATLLGVSALYHRPTWSVVARARMRRLDHSAIFVLIAGTYTPLAFTLPLATAHTMLAVAWAGGIAGVARALFWIDAPKWIVAVLAVGMGWLALLYFPAIRLVTGNAVLTYLVVGGVAYSVGAVIYALRRPDPWPRHFGYHELFHGLVLIGIACHFRAVCIALPVIAP
jgi:hemolysin III